jgi:Mat/Ecp fimbriae major subunit
MESVRRLGLVLTAALVAAVLPGREARAARATAPAAVKIVKPLELTGKQNLNLGQIVMANVTGPTSVSLSPAGTLACGAGLVCSGAALPAVYTVRGTNNMVARIITRPSNLTNAATGATLAFTPIAQPTLALTSSGNRGNDFNVGGSITISPTTGAGLYSGAIDVTVEYN